MLYLWYVLFNMLFNEDLYGMVIVIFHFSNMKQMYFYCKYGKFFKKKFKIAVVPSLVSSSFVVFFCVIFPVVLHFIGKLIGIDRSSSILFIHLIDFSHSSSIYSFDWVSLRISFPPSFNTTHIATSKSPSSVKSQKQL